VSAPGAPRRSASRASARPTPLPCALRREPGVEAGQAVALLGSNGAGKSTVARVASGLVVPTSGHCSSGDRDDGLAHVAHRPGRCRPRPEGRGCSPRSVLRRTSSSPSAGVPARAPVRPWRAPMTSSRSSTSAAASAPAPSQGPAAAAVAGRRPGPAPGTAHRRRAVPWPLALGGRRRLHSLGSIQRAGCALLVVEQQIDRCWSWLCAPSSWSAAASHSPVRRTTRRPPWPASSPPAASARWRCRERATHGPNELDGRARSGGSRAGRAVT